MKSRSEGTVKVAVVSFGHTDSALGLCRALSSHVEVDCYLIFSLDMLVQSVVALSYAPEKMGFVGEDDLAGILDRRILAHLDGRAKVNLFFYHNLKLGDPRNIWLSARLASHLCRRRYDIVHFIGNDLRQLLLRSFLPQTALIHTIHDFVGHSGERGSRAEWLNRHLARTSAVIAQSRYVQRLILAECPGADASMVPFGPLTVFHAFDRGLLPSDLAPGYALFFGRISPYKGIESLIEATRLARTADPTLRVVIAGGGRWDEVDVSEGPGLTTVRHVLDNEELVALVKGAKFVVCPYTDATQSGVVMTAYAFGKPVIATRVGGLEEVVWHERTGLLVPPGDPRALTDAMLLLQSDGNRVDQFSDAIKALERDGEYSWGEIGRKTAEIYRRVASRPRVPFRSAAP